MRGSKYYVCVCVSTEFLPIFTEILRQILLKFTLDNLATLAEAQCLHVLGSERSHRTTAVNKKVKMPADGGRKKAAEWSEVNILENEK